MEMVECTEVICVVMCVLVATIFQWIGVRFSKNSLTVVTVRIIFSERVMSFFWLVFLGRIFL